jgi:hypothetical protein
VLGLSLVLLGGCLESATHYEEALASESETRISRQDETEDQDWIASDDLDSLEAAVDEVVTVRGYVTRTGKPANGHRYLNF